MRAGTATGRPASKAMMFVLLLLALFARGLVPAGYMIAPAENGWPTLTLCSGSGPLMASGGEKHHGHASRHDGHEEDGSAASGSCAFATLLAPVLPPPPFHFAVAVLPPQQALTGFALRTITAPTAAAPPPPSTGPPLLA